MKQEQRVKGNANKIRENMIRVYLIIFLVMSSVGCLCQSATKDFLSYFLNTYLTQKNIYKINDKCDQTFFAKRYSVLIKRIEAVMKVDTTKEIQSNIKNYIRHLQSSSAQQVYHDWFPSRQLFSIDSFYSIDSIRLDFEKKYTKAVRDSQKAVAVYKSLPMDKGEGNTPAALRLKANQTFKMAQAIIEQSIEITIPYLFNNQKSCLVTYVRHLNYWPESKVLLFEKSGNCWSFKRVVFDQELFLDDERSPYLKK